MLRICKPVTVIVSVAPTTVFIPVTSASTSSTTTNTCRDLNAHSATIDFSLRYLTDSLVGIFRISERNERETLSLSSDRIH